MRAVHGPTPRIGMAKIARFISFSDGVIDVVFHIVAVAIILLGSARNER